MTLNFNKKLLNVRGVEQASTLGELLADVLVSENHKESTKIYGWATKMASGKDIELDKADTKTLETLITNNPRMVVLLSAQLLEVFEEAYEAERQSKKKAANVEDTKV